ncbi:MAG: CD225/dispanin family protein [Pyrinomonadaceae bacterium]|nr:CD225/dispanin family protein [Pyrinomonadaceae bacterium]
MTGNGNESEYVDPDTGPLNDIKTNLFLSVLAILFCFPLAIVALVFAVSASSAKQAGDDINAAYRSIMSRKFLIAAFVIGGILFVLNILGRQ